MRGRLPRRNAERGCCIPNPEPDGDLPAQSVGVCMRLQKGTAVGHLWDVTGDVNGEVFDPSHVQKLNSVGRWCLTNPTTPCWRAARRLRVSPRPNA